jgi:Integrase zinc binding domain
MAYDLWSNGYLGRKGTYKLLSQYYFWLKIMDLVKRFIGAYYSYKHAKAFNTKY